MRVENAGGPGQGADGSPPPRYCHDCGEVFDARTDVCPCCGTSWSPPRSLDFRSLTTILTELHGLHHQGAIGDACYATLRRVYERRLAAIRPVPAPATSAASAPSVVPAPPLPAVEAWYPAQPPAVPWIEPEPTAGPGWSLASWTAARQADLLLYLGAFLLSIAALIFVGYQGEALSGPVRFAILAAYTAGFLVLGVLLPRWERVREAGTVFVALGAVLVPINFVALRTQAFGEGRAPDDVVLLAGSVATAALYFTLARRGYGRWYAVPGALAAVLGWGALGSTFALGWPWFGAWYACGAGAMLVLAYEIPLPAPRVVRGTAVTVLALALVYAHGAAVAVAGGSLSRWELPLAYLVATAAALTVLRRRAAGPALAALPPLMASLVAATAWSWFTIPTAWYALAGPAAAVCYPLMHQWPALRAGMGWWRLTVLFAAAGVVVGYPAAAAAGAHQAAVAAGLALSAGAALLWYLRGRWWQALAPAPALAALAGIMATTPPWNPAPWWLSPWVAMAALGYLAAAEIDDARAAVWRASVGGVSMAAIAAGLIVETTAATPGAHLPVLFLLLMVAGAWDTVRRRDSAAVLLPPAVSAFGGALVRALLDPDPAWLGVWPAAAALGHLALARMLPRSPVDSALRRAAYVAGTCAAGWAAVFILPDTAGAAGPVTLALLLAAAVWDAVGARDRAMIVVPPLATALAITTVRTRWSVDDSALGPWLAGPAFGYLLLARLDGGRALLWRVAAGVFAAASLLWAHLAAGTDGRTWLLPLADVLVLIAAAGDAAWRRDRSLLTLPALSALTGCGVLWAAGTPDIWLIYPWMAASVGLVTIEPWWRRRMDLRDAGWPYILGPATAISVGGIGRFADAPDHGLTVAAVTAALFATAAFRTRGALVRLVGVPFSEPALVWERRTLLATAGVFALLTAAYANAWAGRNGAERAWAFVALGSAAWVLLWFVSRHGHDRSPLIAPLALPATAAAVLLALPDPGVATAAMALTATGPALAFTTTRRWPLLTVAAGGLSGVFGFGWSWAGGDMALIPAALAAPALALWAGTVRVRRYGRAERALSIAAIAWGPWGAALVAAQVCIDRGAVARPVRTSVVDTRAWAVATVVLALCAACVVIEGARLKSRPVAVAGSAGLLCAVLMAIAIAHPANVQAYTLVTGFYLVGVGLAFRSSPPLLGPNLLAHESAIIAGLLVLTLPPAVQSFGPGGARYGLELIAGGLLFLGIGIAISSRWLVVGGVLTLTGVAVRWLLIFGAEAPYWLTLGLTGTLLIGVGLLLLVQRERWERFRHTAGRWWSTPPAAHPRT